MAASQSVDDELHGRFIELHQRFPVALLIARIDECIQRQWVLIGSGDLLLDERADDPRLDCRQSDVHARSILPGVPRRLIYLSALFVLAGLLLFVPLPIARTYAGQTIENAGHTPLFFLLTLGLLWCFATIPDSRARGSTRSRGSSAPARDFSAR